MKHTITTFTILLAMMMLSACSSDNDATTQEVTLDIPIDIYSADLSPQSRAAIQGDPGNDAELEAPLYLYVYAYVSEGDGTSHELLENTFTYTDKDIADNWELHDEGTIDERWHKTLRVTFTINSTFNQTLGASRVYAIASRTPLNTIIPTDITSKESKDALEGVTLNMSSITSDQLKDIYSTPASDQSTPVASTDNGIIMGNGKSLTCSTVKLYHVAAKVDFTWEVAEDLQSTVEVKKICCNDMPTTCAIFKPTDNPTSSSANVYVLSDVSTDNPVVATTPGNKWIGRAYAYMLQPSSPGTINYTVEYGGRSNTTGSITPGDTYSDVYTGWYRVVAEVK